MKRFILAWLDVDVQIKMLFDKVDSLENRVLELQKENDVYVSVVNIHSQKLDAQIDINTDQIDRFNKIEGRMDKVFE